MRTQAQREQEFLAKKQSMITKLQGIQTSLEDTHATLQHRFYPSEERYKDWALQARAKDPKRPLNVKEFLRDFCMELAAGVTKHREDLRFASTAVEDWEHWFDGIEEEDLAALESQIEQAAIPLATMQPQAI